MRAVGWWVIAIVAAGTAASTLVACRGESSSTDIDAGEPGPADASVDPDAAPDTFCDPYLPRAIAPEPFIGPDGVEAPVLAVIDGATTSLDMLMYQLSVDSFVDALIAAHGRGVTVRVVLDPDQNGNASARSRLTGAGIEVRDAPAGFEHAHAKVLIADGETAIVMSANLNGFSISSERNYGVIDRDPYDVADLIAIFESDWSGGAPPNLVCTRLVVSPVNARARLLELVNSADDTLELAVMYLSDNQLRLAVTQRAQAGVAVRVLLADPAWIDSNAQTATELGNMGIPVKFLLTDELHAKLIVSDGVPFVGSENMSWTSLESNREVGLFVTEPDAAAVIRAQFEADWTAGTTP